MSQEYLAPLHTSSRFNISDYDYQDATMSVKQLTQDIQAINTTNNNQATDITTLKNKTTDLLTYASSTNEFQHNLKVDGTTTLTGAVTLSGRVDQSLGTNNVVYGTNAMTNATNASYQNNTCVGYGAGQNVTGNNNTALGYLCLNNATNATDNTGAGINCMLNVTTGSGNTGIGNRAGRSCTVGSNNCFIGQDTAGSQTTAPWMTGDNCTLIGYNACNGMNDTGLDNSGKAYCTNVIAIGASAGNSNSMVTVTNQSNLTIIGNNTITDCYLHGNPTFKSTTSTLTVGCDATNTTLNLFNSVPTTSNICGASTTINMGASTGTCTINNANLSCNKITTSLSGLVTLSAGTFLVNNTVIPNIANYITANSIVFVTYSGTPVNAGYLHYTVSANNAFRITSSNASDTSVVAWMLIN